MPYKDRNFSEDAITAAKMTLTDALTNAKLADDSINADSIVAAAVTIAKMNTTLKTGYIPLDINKVRIIAADVISSTTEAGVPDGNTAPSVLRINAATDKAVRLSWAASSSIEVVFPPFALPPDIDSGSDLTVKLRASMAGATDTPTIAVSYFEGVGDTNAGGNSGAVTGTTPATYSLVVLAANVGAAGACVTLGLTPGTHTTDILRLDGAWVEYTRI